MSSEFFIPDPDGHVPTPQGYFGAFGGKFIPEALVAAVDEVAVEYEKAKADPEFTAETGAGQHGVATATACALFGLECLVYMGEVDTRRQALNVARMRMLGADVVPVTTGSRTLKDAINEALRDWVTNVESTHYMLGTAAGPHPFPSMVRDFTRGIGDETRAQLLEQTGDLP